MAKPYREGKGWAVRVRCQGQDIYLKGYDSEAAARHAAEAQRVALHEAGQPAGLGPQRSSLAHAFLRYALERLPSLKGARQDAQRINRYLRAAGLPVIRLEAVSPEEGRGACFFKVSVSKDPAERPVPSSLKAYRGTQAERGRHGDHLRAKLARTAVAEITPHQLQTFIDVLIEAGYEPATIALERAELRRLFNYARKVWSWRQPLHNPAAGLKLPKIDNGRDRVISNSEWQRLVEELERYGNRLAVPAMALLLETTMRSSEPLLRARWRDVDWSRCVLRLHDAKAGARDVPLSPTALSILERLRELAGQPAPDGHILPTTYEALKKAWKVACQRAGVDTAKIHDLRHTGATRYAMEYNGNIPVLQQITGHKTVQLLMRYIHIRADDVVRLMHQRSMDERSAPAGLRIPGERAGLQPEVMQTQRCDIQSDPQPDPARLPANVLRFPGAREAA